MYVRAVLTDVHNWTLWCDFDADVGEALTLFTGSAIIIIIIILICSQNIGKNLTTANCMIA